MVPELFVVGAVGRVALFDGDADGDGDEEGEGEGAAEGDSEGWGGIPMAGASA
ncbi:hypothetical protein [Streptomyces sp. TLI_171]|uniref:hypothetical protein n=1 Tax=Streptomyces sp. TLI_171 TaxID=1938859 RepID=UPI0015D55131|nr:hypothetical protein [Streptomyces sp. TLI_171]